MYKPPWRIASLCLSYQALSWGSLKTSYACCIRRNCTVHSSALSGFLSKDKKRELQLYYLSLIVDKISFYPETTVISNR